MSAKKKNRAAAAGKLSPGSAIHVPVQEPGPESPLPPACDFPGALPTATPRQRIISRIVLIGVGIYIAMLYLLALDQWLHWGLFGP